MRTHWTVQLQYMLEGTVGEIIMDEVPLEGIPAAMSLLFEEMVEGGTIVQFYVY